LHPPDPKERHGAQLFNVFNLDPFVGATLAGYDPTPENTAKLISLTREKNALPKPLCTETKGSSRCEVRKYFLLSLPLLFPFA
jgi:hypothetical protein